MQKLPEVQEGKELMSEAMEWSTFKWLFEKTRVRATADRANEVLDRLDRKVKARWSDEVKAMYKKLSPRAGGTSRRQNQNEQAQESSDLQIRLLVEKVVEADDMAKRARMDAEETFDQAEKQLSTSLAREGCKKAIRSWDLHEKAIRKAEVLAEATQPKGP